jgi:hypothetical protein
VSKIPKDIDFFFIVKYNLKKKNDYLYIFFSFPSFLHICHCVKTLDIYRYIAHHHEDYIRKDGRFIHYHPKT